MINMIKLKNILLCILTLLSSCSHSVLSLPYVDADLQFAYNDWKYECKNYNIRVRQNVCKIDSIVFGKLEEGYWG